MSSIDFVPNAEKELEQLREAWKMLVDSSTQNTNFSILADTRRLIDPVIRELTLLVLALLSGGVHLGLARSDFLPKRCRR